MKNRTIIISQINIEKQKTALLILLDSSKMSDKKKKVTA